MRQLMSGFVLGACCLVFTPAFCAITLINQTEYSFDTVKVSDPNPVHSVAPLLANTQETIPLKNQNHYLIYLAQTKPGLGPGVIVSVLKLENKPLRCIPQDNRVACQINATEDVVTLNYPMLSNPDIMKTYF